MGVTVAKSGIPSIVISQCRRDGFSSYPADDIGCQKCGATGDDLEQIDAECIGTVKAFVTVHRHRGWPETPFRIASIQLDSGPIVRTLLLEGSSGDRVIGQAIATPDGKQQIAFTQEGAE